jgi:hypothetical protein
MERRESIYEDDEAFNASLDALLNGAYVGDSQHSYSALMGPSPTPLAGATAIMAECTEFTAPPPLTVLTAGRKRKLSMALAAGGGAPGRAAGATASLEHPVTTLHHQHPQHQHPHAGHPHPHQTQALNYSARGMVQLPNFSARGMVQLPHMFASQPLSVGTYASQPLSVATGSGSVGTMNLLGTDYFSGSLGQEQSSAAGVGVPVVAAAAAAASGRNVAQPIQVTAMGGRQQARQIQPLGTDYFSGSSSAVAAVRNAAQPILVDLEARKVVSDASRPTSMRGERKKREMLLWEGRDIGGSAYGEQRILEKGHQ